MNGFRLRILALACLTLVIIGSGAQAQFYPGAYYGGGYYPGALTVGDFGSNNYSLSGSFGSPYGYADGGSYSQGYPLGAGYAYMNIGGMNVWNSYATGIPTGGSNWLGLDYYGIGTPGYWANNAQINYGYTPATAVSPLQGYITSTSTIPSGATGSSVESIANGNGAAGSSKSVTVFLGQPTSEPSRSDVATNQNPVVINIRRNEISTSRNGSKPLPLMSSTRR